MNKERIKVLYVDDEEGNLIAFRANFRRDFDVQVATNTTDAFAILAKEDQHVVISDQRMPGMTGSEFLTEVRNRHPKCIRIMLTGFSDIDAVIDAVNRGGIHAYITKPWDPLDLKLRIEQAYEVHALRGEKERLLKHYRQVFDDSGDPIVIVDGDGRLLDANPACERLLGVGRSELLEQKVDRFLEDPGALANALRTARKGTVHHNVDVALKNAQGTLIDCLLTATYQGRSTKGTPIFQAILKDISDRKQDELRLKRMNAELDQAVAERTRELREALDDLSAFSYSVAHDLRSPLKGMRTLSDHLCQTATAKGDLEMNELSTRIHFAATKLTALVDDLLRFARTDSEEIVRRPMDLRQVATECFAGLDTSERQVELVLPTEATAIVHADAAMLRVVITNLLSNALKFTRTRERARIELTCSRDENGHVVHVRDNGVGFDPRKTGQLFGVFKRLHNGSQFEGTGIGLAIVQRVVHKHGGTCWAEGELDHGATISFSLPALQANTNLRKAS